MSAALLCGKLLSICSQLQPLLLLCVRSIRSYSLIQVRYLDGSPCTSGPQVSNQHIGSNHRSKMARLCLDCCCRAPKLWRSYCLCFTSCKQLCTTPADHPHPKHHPPRPLPLPNQQTAQTLLPCFLLAAKSQLLKQAREQVQMQLPLLLQLLKQEHRRHQQHLSCPLQLPALMAVALKTWMKTKIWKRK